MPEPRRIIVIVAVVVNILELAGLALAWLYGWPWHSTTMAIWVLLATASFTILLGIFKGFR
jgi:hypothetical protein